MTSALRGREGGWSKRDDSTDRLREWDSDKGEGVKKSENVVDVVSIAPYWHLHKAETVVQRMRELDFLRE